MSVARPIAPVGDEELFAGAAGTERGIPKAQPRDPTVQLWGRHIDRPSPARAADRPARCCHRRTPGHVSRRRGGEVVPSGRARSPCRCFQDSVPSRAAVNHTVRAVASSTTRSMPTLRRAVSMSVAGGTRPSRSRNPQQRLSGVDVMSKTPLVAA